MPSISGFGLGFIPGLGTKVTGGSCLGKQINQLDSLEGAPYLTVGAPLMCELWLCIR